MAKINDREKRDVFLHYHDDDTDKATSLRCALESKELKIYSYDDFTAGRNILQNLNDLVKLSWCDVMIVTDIFLDDWFKTYERDKSFMLSFKERSYRVIPIKHCDTEREEWEIFEPIIPIDGSLLPDRQASKIVQAVDKLKAASQPDTSVSSDPLDGPRDKMLDFTALTLINFFKMDAKLNSLHADLKGKVDKRCQGSEKPRLDHWLECIQEKVNMWNTGRNANGQFFGLIDSIKKPRKLKPDEMLSRLDGPKGYLYLTWLFIPSKSEPSDYTDLSEYLDSANTFQLLKRCGVFPVWEKDELAAFKDLKEVRNAHAHPAVAMSPQGKRELINKIKEKITESFQTLVMFAFRNEISEIVKEAVGTANQSNVGEDQHDNAAS